MTYTYSGFGKYSDIFMLHFVFVVLDFIIFSAINLRTITQDKAKKKKSINQSIPS